MTSQRMPRRQITGYEKFVGRGLVFVFFNRDIHRLNESRMNHANEL